MENVLMLDDFLGFFFRNDFEQQKTKTSTKFSSSKIRNKKTLQNLHTRGRGGGERRRKKCVKDEMENENLLHLLSAVCVI